MKFSLLLCATVCGLNAIVGAADVKAKATPAPKGTALVTAPPQVSSVTAPAPGTPEEPRPHALTTAEKAKLSSLSTAPVSVSAKLPKPKPETKSP